MSNNTEERSMVALFASPSKYPAILEWIRDNAGTLFAQQAPSFTVFLITRHAFDIICILILLYTFVSCNSSIGALDLADLLAPASLVLLLNLDLQVGFLRVQAISDGDSEVDDINVANQVLENKIQGVVYFYDGSDGSDSLNVLTQACNAAGIPLAINEATASMALKGIVKTKTAYLIFNPVTGQGDSMVQLEEIQRMLESRMILHVVMTQKDRECAEQAREQIECCILSFTKL